MKVTSAPAPAAATVGVTAAAPPNLDFAALLAAAGLVLATPSTPATPDTSTTTCTSITEVPGAPATAAAASPVAAMARPTAPTARPPLAPLLPLQTPTRMPTPTPERSPAPEPAPVAVAASPEPAAAIATSATGPAADARPTVSAVSAPVVAVAPAADRHAPSAASSSDDASPDPGQDARPGPVRVTAPDDEPSPATTETMVPAAPPVVRSAPIAAGPAPVPVQTPTRPAVAAEVQAQVLPAMTRLVARGDGSHTAEVQLHPAALGPVRIEVTLRGQQATGVLHAAEAATVDALRAGLGDLRADLARGGIDLARVEVRHETGPTLAPPPPTSSEGPGLGDATQQHQQPPPPNDRPQRLLAHLPTEESATPAPTGPTAPTADPDRRLDTVA